MTNTNVKRPWVPAKEMERLNEGGIEIDWADILEIMGFMLGWGLLEQVPGTPPPELMSLDDGRHASMFAPYLIPLFVYVGPDYGDYGLIDMLIEHFNLKNVDDETVLEILRNQGLRGHHK